MNGDNFVTSYFSTRRAGCSRPRNFVTSPFRWALAQREHDAFVREHALAGGHLLSAQSGQNVLTSFYKVAAELAGIKLTAHEIEFTKKVLEVNVVAGDDDARTAIADQIEAEDRAYEEAKRKRESRRFPRCVVM